MTVLSAQTIRWQRIITPFNERTVHRGMTYGLSSAGYDIRSAQSAVLAPGGFELISSVEHFKMPNNIVGEVKDKSSWARRGLFVHNTVIEPGWWGYLTLELSAHKLIDVREGDPIAQVIFYYLDHDTEHPYQGKYQNQDARPVEAKEEE